jgi:hypothetical protein
MNANFRDEADAMYFSDQALQELQNTQREIAWKCQCLVQSYLTRDYKDSRAQEFAMHGFARRLKTLARCINNVFKILPPDRTEPATNDEIFDAMINIQAFVFNLFGSIDNLAWIWVQEKPVRNKDGSEIPRNWVGLRKDNKFVRGSLSTEFQEYLKGLDTWFDHLEDFRHALAHRIPLYIPPYAIPMDKEAAYRQLDDRMTDARIRSDFPECSRLRAEQEALGIFVPEMTHSFEEQSGAVSFHPQLLTDFLTIEGLAQQMLKELDPYCSTRGSRE